MINEKLVANSEQELEEKIQQYFKYYPFAGYGTTISETYIVRKQHVVHISRFSSCD